jgi:hypothetical protein
VRVRSPDGIKLNKTSTRRHGVLAQLLSDARVAKPNPEPATVEPSQAELANARKCYLRTFDNKPGVVCGKLLSAVRWYVVSCYVQTGTGAMLTQKMVM